MNVDHIGIATDDLEAFSALYGDLFELDIVHEEEFGGMNVVFFDADGAFIEALEPVEEGTAIHRYVEKSGPGLHHIAFEVDDIEASLDASEEFGIDLIDEEPRPGAWGHTVAFLHPQSTGGVLVEFVEH